MPTTIPMPEIVRKARAARYFKEIEEFVVNLYCRWQDEQGHEDIADYHTAIQKASDEYGIKILKMRKRPFGFIFHIVGAEEIEYQYKVTETTTGYRRIK